VRAARTASTFSVIAVLALGAAACGGGEVEYEEVPGAPAGVTIPDDASTLEGGSDTSATDDGSATETPTPDAGTTVPDDQSGAVGTDPAASTDTGAATAPSTDTGATTDSGGSTAPAQEDGPANDTAPPAGSEAEQFEAFCAENPGAC
jgi:hypothetical protein